MELEVDVLIVGAGPAGSMAAKHASSNGCDVLLVDKKAEIGTPKRCAEGIVTTTLDEVDIIPDKRWIAREIDGIKLISPDNTIFELDTKKNKLPYRGYILERKIFDKHLAMDAIRSGAKVMLRTQAISSERIDGKIVTMLKSFQGDIKVTSKIIIAADGPESRVGKWLGLNSKLPLKDMASCIQYEMVNIKQTNMNQVHIFTGSIVPGGYVWIFPKADDIANVGLGVLKTYADKTAKEYLDDFIKSHAQTQQAQAVEMNIGGDPLGGINENRYDDNIMMVGDAAGFVDPLTGDGIRGALVSGMHAGIVASHAIEKDDFSKNCLKEYYNLTEEHLNKDYSRFNKVKEFLLTLDDKSLNNIIKELNNTDMSNISVKKLLMVIIKSSPKSLLKLGKLL
ncbi:MAG: NAD(P)/FAD-dependent oxidoreductase [Methanosphaera stadtmanae]|nr:NAD(P)/FAD-dependent oxidoreductase [Methanosphaera stadtmanae]